jgi:(S)-ureidoglycine---glyoxylate transaminase
MNDMMEMLRGLFRTNNQWAYPVDGTSRSGIQVVLTSLSVPGEIVLIPIYGRLSHLLYEIAERCGAVVVSIAKEKGKGLRSGRDHRRHPQGASGLSCKTRFNWSEMK